MTIRLVNCMTLLLVAGLTASLGCDVSGDSAAGSVGGERASAPAADATATVRGHFTGRVTGADGSPISLPGVKYHVNINGVTAVGENNNFRPPVAADGTFTLKLPQGLFYPPYATLTVPFEGKNYVVDLDPDDPFQGTRDGAVGIAQHFRWRLTGPRPAARNPDVNNATHWYGITIPVNFQGYRSDTGQIVNPLPDGSKVTWTLKPTSKLMDGSEATMLTVERKWTATPMFMMDALSDLPATNYEISAVATLPDGSIKLVLVEEFAERTFKPTMKLVVQPYANGDTVWFVPTMISWVVE